MISLSHNVNSKNNSGIYCENTNKTGTSPCNNTHIKNAFHCVDQVGKLSINNSTPQIINCSNWYYCQNENKIWHGSKTAKFG